MKDIIIQAIENLNLRKGDKLPSVRDLMKGCHASSVTVQKALKELEEKGKICKIQGKGSFWEKYVVPKIKKPLHPIERLTIEFQKDFERGYFGYHKSFPSSKILQERYKVSPQVLRKFLYQKVEEGKLNRKGNGFFFCSSKENLRDTSRSEIIFVTRCNSWGEFLGESEREMDFLRLIYKTAGLKNYKLILFGINESTGELLDRNGNPSTLSKHPYAVGAILSTLLVQNYMSLFYTFSKVKFPVAIWWEHPLNKIPHFFLKKENFFFFNSTFGENPGIEMARYLKAKNILEVNYFSIYHNSSWSRDRLKGLLTGGIQVHPYTDDEFASPWDYRQRAIQKVEKPYVVPYARFLEKEKLKKIIQRKPIKKDLPLVCVNDEVAGLVLEINETENINLSVNQILAFDNSMESYLLRIPSYDFNTEALAEQMFLSIENPALFSIPKKVHFILGKVNEK